MTVLFFRYLREKRNLLIQFFSKQEEDRKEILETTGYCCFQIFSVLISKTIFIGIFDIRFLVGRWKQLYFVGILREGCHFRMQDERSEDSSVFSVPSLIPSFRERRACAQKFFSFLFFFNFSCHRENFKHFSHLPDQAEQQNRSRPVRVGIKSGR